MTIAFALGLRCALSKPPERVAELFAEALSEGRWGTIYDLASSKEKGLQSWDRDQFVALMTDIKDNRIGQISNVTYDGDWHRQGTSKYFTFRLQSENGGPCEFYVPFFRGKDNWHPAIASLPLILHNLNKPTTRESAEYLYSACGRSEIRNFVRLDDRLQFSVERLGKYLASEIPWNEVSRPYP